MTRSKRYGCLFLLLACLLGLVALFQEALPVRILAVNGLLCCGVLGTAYLTGRAALLGKGADGSIGLGSVLALWPYFLANEAVLQLLNALGSRTRRQEMVPGVWLGRYPQEWGTAVPYAAVVDLTAEFAKPITACEIAYLPLPVLDVTPPSQEQLALGTAFIREHVVDGPVLVHCALGHGRSATLVAAYLLASGEAADVAEALGHIRHRRSGARPNAEQRAALEEYAASLAAGRLAPSDCRNGTLHPLPEAS